MARAILELIGDADSLLKSFKRSSDAADKFGKDLKQLGTTAEQSARAQIQAATRRDARLRQEIAVYRQVAQAAQKGSREQVAAANLATRAEERLARSLAVTSREAKEHARSVAHAERSLGKFGRGVAAGSGLASGLGRTLAFASGGFLATASITGFLRASIEQGSEAAATQKQLAAQFDASGKSLQAYSQQIDEATRKVSQLAGIEDDELKRAFITAFRGTNDVTTALKIQAIAADVARGRHIELSQATLALTKAYGGQATALRRLGVLVPSTLHGMEALDFVAQKFAGQAAAGTTEQQRFAAALKNTEEIIGLGLLPSFNKILASLSAWLAKSQNQKRIQHDTERTVKAFGKLVHVGSEVTGVFVGIAESINAVHLKFMAANDAIARFLHLGGGKPNDFNTRGGGGGGGDFRGPVTGEDVAQRGAAARAGGTQIVPGPKGFKARFANLELRRVQAELTKQKADDRQILQAEAALLRERIKRLGTSRKTLAERTQLTQQLVGIEGQITSIDEQAASNRKSATQRRLQHLQDEKSAANKELAGLKQRESNLRSNMKQIRENFQGALETARQGIGELFSGPVLNFSDEQRKAALGIPNTAADPRALVRDLRAQVQAEAARQRNINRIQRRLGLKRNAPLISELRSNTGDATQVAALAGADRGTLRAFAKQFQGGQRLAQNIARADMRVQLLHLHVAQSRLRGVRAQENHFTIYIDGIEQKQAKVRVKQSAAQRRGPVPGRA